MPDFLVEAFESAVEVTEPVSDLLVAAFDAVLVFFVVAFDAVSVFLETAFDAVLVFLAAAFESGLNSVAEAIEAASSAFFVRVARERRVETGESWDRVWPAGDSSP